MGHIWDEDLAELNNPLPTWWRNLFYATIVFALGYLALYPGLGEFKGLLGWSAINQYQDEMDIADARYGPLFDKYLTQDLVTVSEDPTAGRMGERLFVTYCSQCHGSDARGARGFPNLRDDDWLWGGDAETIKQTIMHGRTGVMPAWELPLGGTEGVADVTDYVLSLSGRKHDAEAALRGKGKFMMCIGCHGIEGTGNPILGAANLTDRIWLHGSTRLRIEQSIGQGRQGQMPAHADFLGEAKVHLLAAYIYGLSEN
jgi:cytochrome c oxidase cbb3-type subunit 3